jgi:hypothetical protein
MLGAPGIMGWYSFVPMMECYHGIVSLDHRLEGHLTINGQTIDFTNGRGYIEKDWGISFPKGWIWLQSNHFFEKGSVSAFPSVSNPTEQGQYFTSLIASVAHIPWLGSHFVGFIVGFWHGGRLFRFATYTGAKMQSRIARNDIFLSFKSRRYRLEIRATKAGTGSLIAPLNGEMTGKVNESLQAEIAVKFYEQDKLVFEGVGRNAGLEAAGAVDVLLTP